MVSPGWFLKELKNMAVKKVEVDGSSVPNKDPFAIGEIGTATEIEQVTENDFVKAVEMEAFMN